MQQGPRNFFDYARHPLQSVNLSHGPRLANPRIPAFYPFVLMTPVDQRPLAYTAPSAYLELAAYSSTTPTSTHQDRVGLGRTNGAHGVWTSPRSSEDVVLRIVVWFLGLAIVTDDQKLNTGRTSLATSLCGW